MPAAYIDALTTLPSFRSSPPHHRAAEPAVVDPGLISGKLKPSPAFKQNPGHYVTGVFCFKSLAMTSLCRKQCLRSLRDACGALTAAPAVQA